jgi:hypothetical protein
MMKGLFFVCFILKEKIYLFTLSPHGIICLKTHLLKVTILYSKEGISMNLEIEKITLPLNKDLLARWKKRDPDIVPAFALKNNGNGIENGYGFGEWIAEKYFRSLGYYLINDEFDLFSKTSKYKRYNEIIKNIISKEKVELFSKQALKNYKNGIKIENLDLFVFNTESYFFAEVKKGKDFLREPQLRFMFLSKEILNTECKLVYLSEDVSSVSEEKVRYELDLL